MLEMEKLIEEIKQEFSERDIKVEAAVEQNIVEGEMINKIDSTEQNVFNTLSKNKFMFKMTDDCEGKGECKYNYELETINDFESTTEKDCPEFVTMEELIMKEDRDDQSFFCDCCGKDDSKCSMLVVIKTKPNPMGAPDRAARTVPEGALILKPNAVHGLGIYARRHLQKGVQLGPFEGMLSKVESTEGFCWKLNEGRLMDTSNETNSNYLRYINSASEESEQNLMAFQYKGKLYYRTCRDIKRNEELLVFFDKGVADNFFKPVQEIYRRKFYTCEFCHIGLRSKEHCNRHRTLCKFQPCRTRKRKKNQKEAVPAKKYKCDSCNYSTNGQSGLTVHRNSKHDQTNIFKCPYCDYVTLSKYNWSHQKRLLDGHILTNHPDVTHQIENKIYTCAICSYTTVWKSHLQRHILKHSEGDTEPYRCDQCLYKTHHKTSLKKHLLNHSNEKPWICSACQRGLNHKKSLDAHIVSNHPFDEELLKSLTNKILSCDVCEFRCVYVSHLKQHLKRHMTCN